MDTKYVVGRKHLPLDDSDTTYSPAVEAELERVFAKAPTKCPGCKRNLSTDDNEIVTCINSRCVYYSPGVHKPLTYDDIIAREA